MSRSLLSSHRHNHRAIGSIPFYRSFFSSASPKPTKNPTPKHPPLLYKPSDSSESSEESTTLQLLSWGRGSSGQLGRTEEISLYPSPFASLQIPPSFRLSQPISGRLNTPSTHSSIKNGKQFLGFGNQEVLKCDREVLGKEDGKDGIFTDSVIKNDLGNKEVLNNDREVLGENGEDGSFTDSVMKNDGGVEDVEVGICCGLFHCGLLVNGKVWMWGKGDGGRLGFGDEDSLCAPVLNPNLESVKSISLGGLHSAALTSQGQVLTWGYGGFGALGHTVFTRELTPRLVEGSWKDDICHISTSGTHTAAITSSGELYTWGREEGDGRLGLGPGRGPDQTGGLSVPTKVEALPVPVSAVSCGGFFTMALTEEGQLWNWGANSNYELGRGDTRIGGWKPQAVPSLKDVRIIQIACGGYHSLALTDDGKVLSWGHGGHGQLGNYSLNSQKIPTPIEALADENVVYIACGGSSCAAVTDNGKLYMWGNSKDSQLGVPGLPELQLHPVEVNFLMEDDGLGSHNVLQVAIGASHAMCLVSRPRITN